MLRVTGTTTADIRGLTLTGGVADRGGGLRNEASTSTTLTNVRVMGNTATVNFFVGGGIFNDFGDLTITGSTISGNQATGTSSDGGVYSRIGSLTIVDSTISGNSAPDDGGGIQINSIADVTTIRNSTISGNTGDDDVHTLNAGVANTFASLGHNLIGGGNSTAAFNQTGGQTGVTNPMLGPLADNGGPTRTHLPHGSPAIDAGSNPSSLTNDERVAPFLREFGGTADVGAVERQNGALIAGSTTIQAEQFNARVDETGGFGNDHRF